MCRSQLEMKSRLQKNMSILQVSGVKNTCMSMTDGHATGDALLLRDPSAHPNRTSQTPHCDDGSPGASGNGTLCLPLSTII